MKAKVDEKDVLFSVHKVGGRVRGGRLELTGDKGSGRWWGAEGR